jgi:hypothetical protein
MEIPAAAMAALRDSADVRHSAGAPAAAAALLGMEGPLSPADRLVLAEALQWWKGQRALADGRVREISARLARV